MPWMFDTGMPWVAVGAALGALARYGVGLWLPVSPGGLPWATLSVNLLGCLAIGLLIPFFAAYSPAKLLLITGFLGSFTTFSAFSLEMVQLFQIRPSLAILYGGISVVGGGLLTAIGLYFAQKSAL